MTSRSKLVTAVVLWAIALAAVLAGVYLSILGVPDRNWLARAGCLVVALGIWSGVSGIIEERMVREGLDLRRRVALARIRARHRRDATRRDELIAQIQHAFDERMAAHQHEIRLSIGLLEASLLLTGTLLWGFGDLLAFLLE